MGIRDLAAKAKEKLTGSHSSRGGSEAVARADRRTSSTMRPADNLRRPVTRD